MKTKLASINVGGNLHAVTQYVNRMGLSDFYLHAYTTGNNSVVVFRLPVNWPMEDHNPLPAEGHG